MRTAILTGANGFVGGALLKELLVNGYKPFCIIRPSSKEEFLAKLDKLSSDGIDTSQVVIVPEDLSNIDSIKNTLKSYTDGFDVFFHLAWHGSAGVDRSDLGLQLLNVKVSADMVELAKYLSCSVFVGAGSIMEDEVLKMSYQRSGKTSPNYIYSSAKLEAHLVCQIKAEALGLDFRWAKSTNAFGEGDNTGRFVNTMLRKMMNNEPCTFSKADQFYDFIYITDAAKAFRLIAERGQNKQIYCLGSGKATMLRDFIAIMKDVTNTSSTLVFSDNTTGVCYLDRNSFSTDTLTEDTDYSPNISFREGISKTVDYLRQIYYIT